MALGNPAIPGCDAFQYGIDIVKLLADGVLRELVQLGKIRGSAPIPLPEKFIVTTVNP